MGIMQVELWVWAVTIAVLGVILVTDFVVQIRRPHEPTFRLPAHSKAGRLLDNRI